MTEPIRILVIDDGDAIRELTTMILAEDGYEVITAPDGEAALKLAERQPPTVILLDMRMPVMDGWKFASAYRQMPGQRAPIIVVSAAHDAPTWAAALGADDVLTKPFDIDDLLGLVERHSHGQSRPRP